MTIAENSTGTTAGRPTDLSVEVATGYLRQYAANPLFAAAQADELLVTDNPYRRPVRPDDLEWIDYSTPVTDDRASELSALIAGRLLLNVNDARTVILPPDDSATSREAFDRFYDRSSTVLGEIVRPFLERHLFSEVSAAAQGDRPRSRAQLVDLLGDVAKERRRVAGKTALVAGLAADPRLAARLVAVQHLARALSAASGSVRADLPEQIRTLADVAGLVARPHAHYQFYLPTTLALVGHLSGLACDPRGALRAAGATAVDALDRAARHDLASIPLASVFGAEEQMQAVVRSAGPASPTQVQVEGGIDAALAGHGEWAVAEVAQGAQEHLLLLERHDRDLSIQLSWLDSLDHYRDKAARLQQAIERERIQVDLDTFDESWEECSTTHVHDEDRLLVIESGEMDFWNCLGSEIHFSAGDMMFIPRHRLHGSVVRTGRCVYHQPVITDDLNRRFG